MSASMARARATSKPIGATEIARHYNRELVYGANDGIITTFAVVAGVAGCGLSLYAVLIIGAANFLPDGLSMGVGSYLAIRARKRARSAGASRAGSQPIPSRAHASRPLRHHPAADRSSCRAL